MDKTRMSSAGGARYVEELGVEVLMQFAPVRRLDDGRLAAVELQLRGRSTGLRDPADLRRAARLMGQQVALDTHKRELASGSLTQTIADVLPVLVTTDLDIDTTSDDPHGLLARMVLSVSPADVLAHPHRTLSAVAQARRQGRMICVDGLGVSEHAVTQLALIEPDIIITAPELLSRTSDRDMAELSHALVAHMQRSHSVVVAQGVDTEALRDAAITVGAAYGTGNLYPAVSDPTALLSEEIVALPDAPVWTTPDPALTTPYAIATQHDRPRRGTKHLLIQMSKALEGQASAVGKSMIVIGTFQRAQFFTALTSARWQELAATTGYAGVYGVGLGDVLDGNIQHAPLDPDDDLVDEWTVAILGPHFAALIAARDRHDGNPDLERTFDFVQSFDRVTVTQAIVSVLRRFTS